MLPHGLGAAGDLVGGLSLEAKCDEESADLRRGGRAAHDLAHHRARLVPAQIVPVEEPRETFLDRHRFPSRKFFARAGPVGREHRLRVELDADDRELAVADRHYFAVLRGRADLEGLGDARRGERVVAAALEWIGQAREETLAVVGDRARLPMHQALGLADLSAVGLHDRLVAEAHAEGRHALAQPADDLQAGARVGRPAGPRRDDQVARLELLRRAGVDLVVADDGHLGAELLEEVREVVRERVVVVDQEDHAPSASSSAASSAASLRRHSSCSAAGSESATMPAPACSRASPPSSTTVRIAMQVSKEPPGSA